ncbi:MAG: TIGR04282 family arsenosugar biosynthesis glycosyltransferase [Bacteroidota bacterium]
MDATLLIFVKNPVAGKTKTRLAQDVGNEMALAMYGQMMDYTRRQTLQLIGVNRILLYSETVPETDMWSTGGFKRGVQHGDDLGARMEKAFQDAFATGAERVIIIGSDCPGITSDLLVTAFAALHKTDVVLGPAIDGGYYLLGMRRLVPELFREMEWSTESVAELTRQRVADQELSLTELPVLSDVDYLEDWLSYGWELPA